MAEKETIGKLPRVEMCGRDLRIVSLNYIRHTNLYLLLIAHHHSSITINMSRLLAFKYRSSVGDRLLPVVISLDIGVSQSVVECVNVSC